MVGPGTGVAPFRAFLQDRAATGAPGPNWLFFGDRRKACDFLYREEIEAWHRDGLLANLDLAWSRDGASKDYVQHHMLSEPNAGRLWDWIDARGAHFYVCGDARNMAKDVDDALRQIVATRGGRSPEQVAEYLEGLKKAKRYQRDVY
jgi:sulfite reductase (NADPH) flavoprotein alpha-component